MKEDYRWLEEHVLGDGDLLVYGRLSQEFDALSRDEIWKELRAAAERYLACTTDRAATFQRIVDEALEELLARDARFGYPPPFCHKGCCNCCHELVYCTDEEARRIHEHCRAAGLPIDHAKLARQLRHVATDDHGDHTGATTWNDQPAADQACVFLDRKDGSCTIWAVRPMVCRVHLAEGTDAHCRPHNGVEDPEACAISYPELSYLLSAIFTIHRASIKKTMGRLLLDLRAPGAAAPPAASDPPAPRR
jgi:Fe-S-cluster containining protein